MVAEPRDYGQVAQAHIAHTARWSWSEPVKLEHLELEFPTRVPGWGGAERMRASRFTDAQKGYGQMLGMTSRGGGLLGGLNGLAVAEADALDELAEALGAVEAAPVALG